LAEVEAENDPDSAPPTLLVVEEDDAPQSDDPAPGEDAYRIEGAAVPARRPRGRRPKPVKPTRESKLREIKERYRRWSPAGAVAALLLMVPVFLESFGPPVPLIFKIALGTFCGAGAGLLCQPNFKYFPLGLAFGIFAGVSSTAALHFYDLAIPPPSAATVKELFIIWALCVLPPFVIFYPLVLWLELRPYPAPIPDSGPQGFARLSKSLRFGWPTGKRLILCAPVSVFVLPLVLIGYLALTQAVRNGEPLARRVLIGLVGGFFALLFLFLMFSALFVRDRHTREAAYYQQSLQGFSRGLKHALPMLGVVGGVWCVLAGITLFFPVTSPIAMITLVYGLPVALVGYIWYGIVRVHDGLGWPPVIIMSYYRYPVQASEHIWRNPTRYGRPYWLANFGCLLFLATFGLLLLREYVF
jgi:hypothetical protein